MNSARHILSLSGAVLFAAVGSLSCSGDTSTNTAPPPPPPQTVASVSVSPGEATVITYDSTHTQQFEATVRDQNGAVMTTATVTWASSDPTIATVDGNGLATAVSEGQTMIRAETSGVVGTARMTVVHERSLVYRGIAVARTGLDSVPMIAVHEGGDLLGVVGQLDGSGGFQTIRGAAVLSGGDRFVYWFGEEGLPERAVFNDHVLVFTDYSETMVDVTVIAPDGSTTVLDAVELGGDPASRRRASSVSAAASGPQEELWAALRGVGDGVEAIQCSSALASASASLGLSLLPCVGLIVAAADFIEADNAALEASGLAFRVVEGVNCPPEHFSLESCIAVVADGLSDEYWAASDQVQSMSTSSIDVTVLTTGDLIDADGYVAQLTPTLWVRSLEIAVNGDAVRWGDLLPGPYSVTLDDIADTCQAASGNPVRISLASGEQVVVAFVVECEGIPPVISNITSEVTELNVCELPDGPPLGSVKEHTFDYTDGSGDAVPGGHLQIVYEFFFADGSSSGGGAFTIPDGDTEVSGDGSSGEIYYWTCVRWGGTSLLRESISLVDVAGNVSNALLLETPRPEGANVAMPAGGIGRGHSPGTAAHLPANDRSVHQRQ